MRRRSSCATCRRGSQPDAPARDTDLGGPAMAEAVGFYTDTTVCIRCKACQVACHQWNGLPAELADQPSATRPGKSLPLPGKSYDNTVSFSDGNWRRGKFIEKSERPDRRDLTSLMMSTLCKHCA